MKKIKSSYSPFQIKIDGGKAFNKAVIKLLLKMGFKKWYAESYPIEQNPRVRFSDIKLPRFGILERTRDRASAELKD